MEDGTPPVPAGRKALSQSDCCCFESKLLLERLCQALVALFIKFAGLHVGPTFMGKPEALLSILFIGNADINILHQRPHHLLCLRLGPQFSTVVEVTADGHASPGCCFTSLLQ